jgi:hypothetical protein
MDRTNSLSLVFQFESRQGHRLPWHFLWFPSAHLKCVKVRSLSTIALRLCFSLKENMQSPMVTCVWWRFTVLLKTKQLQMRTVICLLYTRAVCKVRGLILLLRVETLWRCGDGLFFEVPPLASDALPTTLHLHLENVLQAVNHFKISCLGAAFSRLGKPISRMGRDLNWILFSAWKKWISGTPLEHPPYRRAPRQAISKWSTVYSTFSRSGWSLVRSASLAKGSTSEKRPSPHLHKVPIRSNKVSPRTLQTPLMCLCVYNLLFL